MPSCSRTPARALIAAVLGTLLLGACGSGGHVATVAAPGTKRPAATTTVPTTANAAETREWVEAATTGLLTDDDPPPGLTHAIARCTARAIVETLTVNRLRAAGATLAQMRDPNADLPKRLSVTTPMSVKLALGAALQRCGMGQLLTSVVVAGFTGSLHGTYKPDAASGRCLSRWVDAPARRLFLANLTMHGSASKADFEGLAGVILNCFDFAAMIAPAMHVTLDSGERNCIDTAARSDPELRTALAEAMQSGGKSSSTDVFEGFGMRIVRCLNRGHLDQIGTPSTTTAAKL